MRIALDGMMHESCTFSRLLADLDDFQLVRTASMKGPPFHDSVDGQGADRYWPGMLPQTDSLVRRAMSIGIGVSDTNLGSNFGVTVRDGEAAVRERAARFREAAMRRFHS